MYWHCWGKSISISWIELTLHLKIEQRSHLCLILIMILEKSCIETTPVKFLSPSKWLLETVGQLRLMGMLLVLEAIKMELQFIQKLSDMNTKKSWQCSRRKSGNYQVRRLHPLGTMDVYKMSGDMSGPQWSTWTPCLSVDLTGKTQASNSKWSFEPRSKSSQVTLTGNTEMTKVNIHAHKWYTVKHRDTFLRLILNLFLSAYIRHCSL